MRVRARRIEPIGSKSFGPGPNRVQVQVRVYPNGSSVQGECGCECTIMVRVRSKGFVLFPNPYPHARAQLYPWRTRSYSFSCYILETTRFSGLSYEQIMMTFRKLYLSTKKNLPAKCSGPLIIAHNHT